MKRFTAALVALVVAPIGPQRPQLDLARTWVGRGPSGGLVTTIAVTPGNPDMIYAGSAVGVFLSSNAGQVWTAATAFGTMVVDTLLVNPEDTQVIFAVAESRPGFASSLFRSSDGGHEWTLLLSGLTGPLAFGSGSPAPLLVGSTSGLFRTDDKGNTFRPLGLDSISALATDPLNAGVVYAGDLKPIGNNLFGQLMKSIDAGETWSETGFYDGVSSIAVDRASEVYVVSGIQAFRSADGGASWDLIGADLGLAQAVAVSRTDPSTLFLETATDIWASGDRGSTWKNITADLPGSPGALTPSEDGSLYIAAGGKGLFKLPAGASGWIRSSDGMVASQIASVVVNPNNPTEVVVASASFCRSLDGGRTWSVDDTVPISGTRFPGEGALAMDPSRPEILYTASESGGVLRSSDSGKTWTRSPATGFAMLASAFAIDPQNTSTIFVADGYVRRSVDGGQTFPLASQGLPYGMGLLAMDPTDPSTLYTSYGGAVSAGSGLFRSGDGGESWQPVVLPSNDGISAITTQPGRTGVLYLATYNGLYRTADRGDTWMPVVLSGTSITCLAATDHLVVVGTRSGDVLLSRDDGANWTSIAEGLPPLAIRSATIDPRGEVIYVGTDGGGVFRLGRVVSLLGTR